MLIHHTAASLDGHKTHTVLQERNIPLLHVGFQLTQSKRFREPSPRFNITAIIGKESDVGGNLSVVKTYQSLKS